MSTELFTQVEALAKLEELTSKREEINGLNESYLNGFDPRMKSAEEALAKANEELGEEEKNTTSEEIQALKLERGQWENAVNELRKRINDEAKAKKEALEANYEQKKEILNQLQELTKTEENIGNAFRMFRDLRDKWQAIGKLPAHRESEVEGEYRKMVEFFYYNINIYKELKENDLKKNLETRKELVDKIEAALKIKKIKDMQTVQRACIKEWDAAGAVDKEEWEALKSRFFDAFSKIGEIVKDHFAAQKDKYAKNLAEKQAICKVVEEISEAEFSGQKGWKKATDKVIELQRTWKTIGFAEKKNNEEVWKQFRTACDTFFSRKEAFFAELKGEFDVNRDKKKQLIDRLMKVPFDANDDGVNWKQTNEQIIKIQKDWKRIGSASQKDEQKLWKTFRAQCDKFFDAKKAYFGGLDARLDGNAEAAKKLIADAKKATKENVEQIIKSWFDLGRMPKGAGKGLQAEFDTAISAQLKANGVDDVDSYYFELKVNGLLEHPDANGKIRQEVSFMKDQKQKVQAEINQLENNLGFFGNADKTNPLVSGVYEQIDAAKLNLDKLDKSIRYAKKTLDIRNKQVVTEE